MAAVTPYIAVVQAAAGTFHIAAAVAGQKIRLRSLAGFLSVAGTVKLQDTAAAALSGAMDVGTTGAIAWPDNPEGWLETAVGVGLDLVSTTGKFNGVASVAYIPG